MGPEHLTADRPLKDLARARDRYLSGAGVPDDIRPMVLASWRRSAAHGVDPRELSGQDPDPARLAAARAAAAPLVASAEPFLTLMHEALSGRPHLVALSDADGLILEALVGPGLSPDELREANLFAGASWHERDIGCNGIGTCLVAGEPVLLIGPEHFQEAYVGWTCIGVPVRNPAGVVVGAIDLSVPNEEAHPHAWGWTLSVARGIEAALARPVAGGRAEAELKLQDMDAPLQSVRGVLEGLISGLDLPSTHARFVDEAISELDTLDVEDLARTNRLLRRDRELLERLVDEIPVMVVVYDPAIQEVRLNRHVERVVGWTNDDLADGADIMELCYPDPAYRAQVRLYMESLEPGWRDFDMTARDGSVVRTSWANIPLVDNRRVGIGIDVTERKAAHERLQTALASAQQAVRERDNLLAVVSHDLRNPLSTMSIAGSLLLEDIPEAKKQAQVTVIRRSVTQMQRLIDDLLDAARIDGGGFSVEARPTSAVELVRSAVESHRALAQDRSVEITADDAPDVPVLADQGRVLQLFGNLIANAIEHTPSGGRVTVGGAVQGDEVVFSVRDTGPGIRAEDMERVFERYWQSEDRQRRGTGLGLAIAKGIVEAHAGRIWVEGEEGEGATLRFTLPLAGDGRT